MPGAPEISTSAAAERNRQPILEQLRGLLPAHGKVLEIASGTGQHVAHFAAELPRLRWQPSDREPGDFAAITARRDTAALGNVADPVVLDVLQTPWNVDAEFDALLVHQHDPHLPMGNHAGAVQRRQAPPSCQRQQDSRALWAFQGRRQAYGDVK